MCNPLSAKTNLRIGVIIALMVLCCALTKNVQAQKPAEETKKDKAANSSSLRSPIKYGQSHTKPRVIVTTDGEIDDRCSMIRFLLYSNEFDVEGLIYSSSMFHWLGQTWSGVEWIGAELEMYSRVYPSLRRNADGYPSPDELRNKVYVGNIANVGDMTSDSPGTDRIVQVLLDDKPGPVYLQAWGGLNTVARALYRIQHEHPEQIEKVSRKAVIYNILDQDKTYREYIRLNWPKLRVLISRTQFSAMAYYWRMLMPASESVFFERPWMEGHISNDHGALTGAYESLNGAFRSEGDSPSYIYEIEVGLRSMENPQYGGWGGRFEQPKGAPNDEWLDADDDGDHFKPIWRWTEAIQNDFAARADWCVKPYEEANHPPIVFVDGELDRTVHAGETVTLSVHGSTDPDGNRLHFNWWQYREAGTAKTIAVIDNAGRDVVRVHVPDEAQPGETFHVIAEVRNGGKPPLTRYARFILTIDQASNQSSTIAEKANKEKQ